MANDGEQKPRRKIRVDGYVPPSSKEIVSRTRKIHSEWLSTLPDLIRAAAERLLTDFRVRDYWGQWLDQHHFGIVISEFIIASDRSGWTTLSQREREKWQNDFEETLDSLVTLIKSAPVPPDEYGFPVRDEAFKSVVKCLPITLPEVRHGIDASSDPIDDLEAIVDSLGYTIVDALEYFRVRQRASFGDEQVLAKPRDDKAARAHFIAHVTAELSMPDDVVATITSVLFEDESVDDRLVRRFKHRDHR